VRAALARTARALQSRRDPSATGSLFLSRRIYDEIPMPHPRTETIVRGTRSDTSG